jgi:cytochrome c556
MKRLLSIGVAAALAAVSATSFAQGAGPPSPEAQAASTIQTRQGLFKVIASQWGPVGGMLRNQVPFDAEVVARNAGRVQMLSGMIAELHTKDVREFKATKTSALDGIWNSQADFKVKADALTTAAGALATVAKTGDKAATLKAAGDVGKACGACHDNYRAK